MQRTYVIETKSATKSYGSLLALDRVSIHVAQGSIYGLIGDNGAGKSTLLKLLAGHISTDSGEILLFGKSGEKDLRRCRRQTGTIIEQPGFFPGMTAEQMLEYYRIQKGVPGREKVEETLKLTGIWEKRKCKCKNLSLGQKQRLGLAIALISQPQLLILDEPINGLDPSGIIELRSLFHRLNQEKNITILLSSHILTELQQTADTFGFLHKGQILEELPAEKLLEKCKTYLTILVNDPQSYMALLDQQTAKDSCRALPDQSIEITNPKREPEFYSQLAAEHGILIRGLEQRHASLEEYFINLKGGKQ